MATTEAGFAGEGWKQQLQPVIIEDLLLSEDEQQADHTGVVQSVINEDLLLDEDEQQADPKAHESLATATAPATAHAQAAADVFAGIPKNLDQQLDESKFFVALPCFNNVCIDPGFSGLQVPAAYLQDRLTAVQQQAARQQPQQQPKLGATQGAAPADGAAAVQLLLPTSTASCSSGNIASASVQLVSLGVEWHPQGSGSGAVGIVQQLTQIMPSSVEMQACQVDDGTQCYR